MAPAPTSAKAPRTRLGIAVGVAAGAVFAIGLYLTAQRLQPGSGLILVSVLLIPPAASALAVLVAGIHGKGSSGQAILTAIWVVSTLLLSSAIILREGVICLAMAAPIFYPLGIIGAVLATFLRDAFGRRTPPAMVVLAPLILLLVEQPTAYPTMDEAVMTQVEIDAPIEIVWREAIEIRDISTDEQRWTFTQDVLRVPRPVDARLVQRRGGLARAATWAGDVRFFETVTDWRPGQTVAWRFEIPEASADRLLDQHLRLDEDYLRLQRGSYTFEPISPTRTRLTLRTDYMARTPFNMYAKAWGDLLLGDIHRNVLHVVSVRAESKSRDASRDAAED